jgi:hypothetical protein
MNIHAVKSLDYVYDDQKFETNVWTLINPTDGQIDVWALDSY